VAALRTGNHIGLPLQILAKLNHYPSRRQVEKPVRLSQEFLRWLIKEVLGASPPKTPGGRDLLETKISENAALIKRCRHKRVWKFPSPASTSDKFTQDNW
jgi:hypothetical protein